MTQENKDLLLKDLCARFAYGLKVSEYFQTTKIWTRPKDCRDVGLYYILKYPERTKPFLRPMSSMTEEERSELRQWGCLCMTPDDCVEDVGVYGAIHSIPVIDWLNAHHFDYRGMIEKGLALPAPEGMY